MAAADKLVTQHLDLWATAIKRKSTAGRGSSSKVELYGIKKLRELILELAVRGLLVPQDPMDEPVSDLLKRIAAEKAKLVKEGKIKKEKPLAPVGDDEKYFRAPGTWEWCRLQEFSEYVQRGKGPAYADFGAVRAVSQKCVQWAGFDISASRFVDDASLSGYKDERFLKGDDLLWNSTGTGTVGRANVLSDISEKTLVADSHVTVIRPLIVSSRYLCSYIWSPGVQTRIEPGHEKSLVSGSTQQVELNTSAVMALPVPIPPLNEQVRIVAKVDELMALCDQLEQQTEASLGAHQTLVATLLNALTSAADHAQFASSWLRTAGHFDTLLTTEESIDQLKQTILQLAVMGKLVPQDPNDEPASELLKKIATEKARLLRAGEVKKEKMLSPVSEDEKPFALPDQWAHSYLQEICLLITDGTHQTPTYTSEGRPFISAQCVKPFKFIPDNCRYVSEEDYKEYIRNRKPERGDILLSRVGAGIGEAALIDQDLDFAIYVSTALLKLPNAYFSSEYLVLWLNSPVGRYFSTSRTLGKGVSQGNLNLSLIRTFVISVPPLNEQYRIVAKVDEIMTMCDQLKARLADAQTTQLHLADALAEQALAEA